jgi:hypothetical protein
VTDSSVDFATPIQSYAGQAWRLSKSMPTIELPGPSSGSSAVDSDLNE